MKITYPDAGWFYFDLLNNKEFKKSVRVSYLCYPFKDLALFFKNIIDYNICGNVIFEGEGQDSILYYNDINQILGLRYVDQDIKDTTLSINSHMIESHYLPLIGLLSLYLYSGENILKFSTDIHIEENDNEPEFSIIKHDEKLLAWKLHKNKYSEMNEIKSTIHIIECGLNSSHIIIPKYISTGINKKWINHKLTQISDFLKLIGIHHKSEKEIYHLLSNIIYGHWKNIPYMSVDNIIVPDIKYQYSAFIGIKALFSLLSLSEQAHVFEPRAINESIRKISKKISV